MKSLLISAAAATMLMAACTTADAALGVDFDAPNASYMVTQPNSVAGWSFTAKRDLFVKALGIYDHEPDLFHSETHSVGLWKADGTLLTSVSIDEPQYPHARDLVNGKYHMTATEQIMLKAGQTYLVAATVGPDAFAWFPSLAEAAVHNLTFDSQINYTGSRYASSATLAFPATELSGIGLFGANIDLVPTPVPAAAWLLGSGLASLIGLRRRRINAA